MDDTLKQLLAFMFQRADATQTFWNFYAGAVTAVLGLVTAGKAEWLNRWVCLGITFAFLVFAVGNFIALDAVRAQRQELMNVAKAVKGYAQMENVVAAVRPPTKQQLRLFHGALDVGTVVAIWGVPIARRRYELTSRSRGRA